MLNNLIYNIRFKCHKGMCYTKRTTSVDIQVAGKSAHAVACAHCGNIFYVEAERDFARLHSGTHSRIVDMQQVVNG